MATTNQPGKMMENVYFQKFSSQLSSPGLEMCLIEKPLERFLGVALTSIVICHLGTWETKSQSIIVETPPVKSRSFVNICLRPALWSRIMYDHVSSNNMFIQCQWFFKRVLNDYLESCFRKCVGNLFKVQRPWVQETTRPFVTMHIHQCDRINWKVKKFSFNIEDKMYECKYLSKWKVTLQRLAKTPKRVLVLIKEVKDFFCHVDLCPNSVVVLLNAEAIREVWIHVTQSLASLRASGEIDHVSFAKLGNYLNAKHK